MATAEDSVELQTSGLRSRQRTGATAVALGLAMAIALGLLSVTSISSTTMHRISGDHAARNLRYYPPMVMEETQHYSVEQTPSINMEAQGLRGQTTTLIPSTIGVANHNDPNAGKSLMMMEAKHESPDDAEAKAEEAEKIAKDAEKIAKDAEKAAQSAEEHATAAEAAAELAIMMQVGDVAAGSGVTIDSYAVEQDPQADTPSFQDNHA